MKIALGLLMLVHPVMGAPLWTLPLAVAAVVAVIMSPSSGVAAGVAACAAAVLAIPSANLWDALLITGYLLAVESAGLRQQAPALACAVPATVAVALMTYADAASLGDWALWLAVAAPIAAAAGFSIALLGRR